MNVVEVKGLVKRYGDLLALDHLDLSIRQGEVFGLLGPNGSGKTTAINCILQLLTYSKGEISLFGEPMAPSRYDIKRRIGIVPQNIATFSQLSVFENIDYFCSLYIDDRARRRELVQQAIAFVGLEDYVRFRPRRLSGGLARRLNIACGIAHRPELVIFDEPTVAVDPQSRNAILEGIKRLNAEGSTIIYTSHYMEEVERICSRITIMDHGQILASGTNAELKGMVDIGERIEVELGAAEADKRRALTLVRELPGVSECGLVGDTLKIRCSRNANRLVAVLDALRGEGIGYGRVFSEPPTLNDVFLEITGKELRD